MTAQDYYEILGVARGASPEEIKRAYRKRALELHPDRNPDRHDAEEQFKRLTEAYSVLGDPEKRARYDRFGAEGLRGGASAGGVDPSIFTDLFTNGGLGGLESLFEQFFGPGFFGGAAGRGFRGAADLHHQLEIDFMQAAFGADVDVEIARRELCSTCAGTGAKPGGVSTCRTCRGSGRVAARIGFMQIAQTCPACGGVGRRIDKPCEGCRGHGRIETSRTVTVRVPAGVDAGARLRLSGQGDADDAGGRPGDLYIDIDVRPHDRFIRKGPDVHSVWELDLPDLVLGGRFTVETVHGPEDVELPRGTSPGAEILVRGKGVARLGRRGQGDHVLHVVARTPTRLSAEEKKLWEELRRLAARARESGREEGGLLDKVKDFLGGD